MRVKAGFVFEDVVDSVEGGLGKFCRLQCLISSLG